MKQQPEGIIIVGSMPYVMAQQKKVFLETMDDQGDYDSEGSGNRHNQNALNGVESRKKKIPFGATVKRDLERNIKAFQDAQLEDAEYDAPVI